MELQQDVRYALRVLRHGMLLTGTGLAIGVAAGLAPVLDNAPVGAIIGAGSPLVQL